MYNKNLKEDLRLRLSGTDMDFLRALSDERGCSVSEVIRSIIGEYRRSIEAVNALKSALEFANQTKEGAVHGNTETHIDNKL